MAPPATIRTDGARGRPPKSAVAARKGRIHETLKLPQARSRVKDGSAFRRSDVVRAFASSAEAWGRFPFGDAEFEASDKAFEADSLGFRGVAKDASRSWRDFVTRRRSKAWAAIGPSSFSASGVRFVDTLFRVVPT
jgi:hypothetical protein